VKAKLQRHFETIDPVMARIVSIAAPFEPAERSYTSAFEALTRSIASQQISWAVARKMIERLQALHGGRFPTPADLATATPEALRGVGFSFAKIAALKDLAAHALDGRLPHDEMLRQLDDEAIIERCIAVRGIGRWTVQMLLMFHLGRQDVMPADDFGVRKGFQLAYGLKGLPKTKALLAYTQRWQPYRSAGAWYLWRAVELHQQGTLPRRAGRAPRIEIELPKAPVPKGKSGKRSKPAAKLRRKRQASRRAPQTPRQSRRGRSARAS
jgi:DNA-3-methyladenine glycosylase II